MAKRFERFTKPYQGSSIPFLLAEVVTNGGGQMVDLIFRYVNTAAAMLLDAAPETLNGSRFCQAYSPALLPKLQPVCDVAFSGSSASFSLETLLGRQLSVSCYQLQYGVCACILEEQHETAEGMRNASDLVLERFPGGVAVLEVGRGKTRLLSFTQSVIRLSGYSQREFLNRFSDQPAALIAPEDRGGLLQNFLDAAHAGQGMAREVRLVCADGQARWVSLQAEYVSGAAGALVFYVLLLDIDRQRRTLCELEQTRQELAGMRGKYDELLNSMPGGYCLLRFFGNGAQEALKVSRGLAEIVGYSQEEIMRRMSADPLWRVHPDDRAEFSAVCAAGLEARNAFQHIFRVLKKGGRAAWLTVSAAREPQEDGGFLLYAAFTDVTREKEAEDELKFRSELCSLLLERANSISVDYDPQRDSARLEMFDSDGRRMVRTLPEYRHTLSTSSTVHPDYRKAAAAILKKACARPGTETLTYLGNYGGQDFRWYQAVFVSLADSRGNVVRIVIKADDISERKAAEMRFLNQRAAAEKAAGGALLSARLDLSADRLLDVQSKSSYLLRTAFGNTAGECLDSLQRNIPPEQQQLRFHAAFSRSALLDAFRRGNFQLSLAHRFLSDEHENLWVRSSVELVENPENQHIEANVRIASIDEERRREAVLSALVGRDHLFVLSVDIATRRYRVYRADGSLSQEVGPDFYRAALDQIESVVVLDDRRRLRGAILLPNILKRLKREPVYTFSLSARRGEDAEIRVQLRFSLLDEETLLLTAADITALTLAQQKREQKLNDSLRALQEDTRSKGFFLSCLSHELLLPIRAILASAEQAPQNTDPAVRLEEIARTARYLEALTGDILDMSRIEHHQIQLHERVFSLRALLAETAALIPALSQPQKYQYQCSLPPDLGDRLIGDDRKLRQILSNLLSNAVRYTPEGGRITLEVSRIEKSRGRTALRFLVGDTGCGIAPDLLPRLFEPFARADGADERSVGLGLAVCKNLTALMGGTISAQSIPGVGSKFYLELSFKDAADAGQILRLDGERYLLAQETPEEAALLSGFIRSAGGDLVCAADGLQALQQFVSHPEGWFSAVVLDRTLPGMDGSHTAAAIRGWDRNDGKTIPILFTEAAGPAAADGADILTKPVSREALLRALKASLV